MCSRERRPFPFRDAELRKLVKDILEELPEDVREAVENVVIHIEDCPSPSLLQEYPDLDPRILGLYIGVPLSKQTVFGAFYFPAQIYLFRANIARYAHDRRRLRLQLRETLLHEIGHHLGLDEDDLRNLER